MAIALKVFTLNCWGLPFPVICKNRQERMKAIGVYLKSHDYDFIILEEVWVKSDYNYLKEMLNQTHHPHYFYSGTIGSGICVFSKHPIIETSFHCFNLNGHAHKIFHGDWFGGKGVGMCRIRVDDLDINLYCSHFHAQYNLVHDEYHSHRVSQSFELSQLVKATMDSCDMVIVAGDLNTRPDTVGYRLFTYGSKLQDSWLAKTNGVENEHGGTCDVAGNTYTSKDDQRRRPQGQRIDYVLYRARKGLDITAKCETGIGKIPELGITFSDHEAVMATLTIEKKSDIPDEEGEEWLCKDLKETLQESVFVLDKGVSQCLGEGKFFQLMIILLSAALYLVSYHLYSVTVDTSLSLIAFLAVLKFILVIGIGFSVWEALIIKRAEFHGLVACKENVKRVLNSGGYRSRSY